MPRAQTGRAAAVVSWDAAGGSRMRNQLGFFIVLAENTSRYTGHATVLRGTEWDTLRQQP